MERRYRHLFSPFRIKGLILRNRIISGPIGGWVFLPSNYIFDYGIAIMFEEKALGGAAAVTVGHTEVNVEDCEPFGLYFDSRNREGAAALAEFAEAVKQRGVHVSVQLNYAGNYGPSENIRRGLPIHAMTEEKIMKTIGHYADAARKLRIAGFDMCMIHGGHGWLPTQFLSSVSNRRTDGFGGRNEINVGNRKVSA